MSTKKLTAAEKSELLKILKERFEKNMKRHKEIKWPDVEKKLGDQPAKLWSLQQMEDSGGEPDVVSLGEKKGGIIFADCAAETPKGRRSLCYDGDALRSRKEHKPSGSAAEVAEEIGIQLLNEEQYRQLQTFGEFDTKTSSWLSTPAQIRKLGGAIFGDRRYNQVFIYHNGAESYYAARGFRGLIAV
jgi:hypothetical protein